MHPFCKCWVRHPFCITTLLLVISCFLLTENGFIGLAGVLVFVLLAVRTPSEEAKLVDRFGEEYRAYLQKSGRFVPRLW